MFWIKGLAPKLDLEEMKWKMHEDVVSSIWNFLIYVVLVPVTPFILAAAAAGVSGSGAGTARGPPTPAPRARLL